MKETLRRRKADTSSLHKKNPRISWEIHRMVVRGEAFLLQPQPLSTGGDFSTDTYYDHLGYLLHGQQLPRLHFLPYPWLGRPMLMFCGGFVVWLGRPMLIFWGGFCPPFRPPKPFYIYKASSRIPKSIGVWILKHILFQDIILYYSIMVYRQ
jgi:hypothetical protein